MVCACPSSVRLNEWSASSRAALGPVARRLGVPDGVDNLAVLGEPPGGEPVQRRHFLGQRPAQLQPQQVREQVVVAEPGALGVERHDERVRVLEVQQDPFRARAAGQQVGQLAVDPVEQGGAQQQMLDVGAAGGPASRRSGTRRPCGRCRRTPRRTAPGPGGRPGRAPPAAGPRPTLRSAGAAAPPPASDSAIPDGVEQLAGLPLGEAQIRRADLGQLARQAQLVQAQRQIAAGGQDRVHVRGEVRQQPGELGEGLRRGQLVQIVDDQDDAAAVRRRAPTAPGRPSPGR